MAVKTDKQKSSADKNPLYVIRAAKFAFSVPLTGEDGKPIPELDGNGNQKYVYGKKQYLAQKISFKTVSRHPEKALSVFQVTDDTPVEVCKRLAELAQDPDAEPRVMLEIEHIKRTNVAQYAEMSRREKAEKELAAKDESLAAIMEAARGVSPASPESIKLLLEKIKEVGK
jgi:hypothetical protein